MTSSGNDGPGVIGGPVGGEADEEAGEEAGDPLGTGSVRMTAWVHGGVQGVGFRWWTRARALEMGLAGHAANLPDGRVEVVVEGPPPACRALLDLLRGSGAPGRVTAVVASLSAPRGLPPGFIER